MRKTVSITISGQLFHIEEQAYRKLDEYLESIRYHFSTYEDRDEIVSDIEGRVAEHFAEKLTKSRNVVSEADVDDLIAHLGTVKDFEAFASDAPAHDAPPPAGEHVYRHPPKRLYRDPDDQMIAGVASGIANYFGIDPTIVRLLFAASLLFGGAGFVIYVILWIVMPEAKTTSEKMEMRGQPLTLRRIEETIRENIPAARERIKPGAFTRAVRFPFTLLRQCLRFIGTMLAAVVPVIGRMVGFFIAAGSGIALFFLVFVTIMLTSGAWEQYMDVPLRSIAGNSTYYLLLLSGFVTSLVPAVFVMFVGASLLLLRNVFRFPVVISLLALWVMGLMLGAVIVGREGPELARRVDQFVESYDVSATRSIEIDSFRSIHASGNYDVRVRAGTGDAIVVTGSQVAVEQIRTEVQDGVLTISREYRGRLCIICLGNNAEVDITMTDPSLENVEATVGASIDLEGIDLTGDHVSAAGGSRVTVRDADVPVDWSLDAHAGSSLNIEAANPIDRLAISANAGSHVIFAGDAESVTAEARAGASAELNGSGSTLTATAVAGSRIEATEFTVREATVDAAAGGRIRLNASERITGSAKGGGSVEYRGQPAVDVDHDPSGYIDALDDDSFIEE